MPTVTHRSRASGDRTVYPAEEKVGEDLLQRWIAELARPLIERWNAHRGVVALTGADQFVYFRRGDTRGRVAPDVFVLPGVSPDRRIRSWRTWEHGIVPSFALEIVSTDVDKDYIDAPALYAELGVRELVVLDPDFEEERDRFRFQVFRHVGRRGLVRVAVTNEDRLRSKTLGCWLRVVGSADRQRLRIGLDPDGEQLFPTEAEAERAARERERTEKERAVAEAGAERTARLAAEAEVARLRADLARRTRR